MKKGENGGGGGADAPSPSLLRKRLLLPTSPRGETSAATMVMVLRDPTVSSTVPPTPEESGRQGSINGGSLLWRYLQYPSSYDLTAAASRGDPTPRPPTPPPPPRPPSPPQPQPPPSPPLRRQVNGCAGEGEPQQLRDQARQRRLAAMQGYGRLRSRLPQLSLPIGSSAPAVAATTTTAATTTAPPTAAPRRSAFTFPQQSTPSSFPPPSSFPSPWYCPRPYFPSPPGMPPPPFLAPGPMPPPPFGLHPYHLLHHPHHPQLTPILEEPPCSQTALPTPSSLTTNTVTATTAAAADGTTYTCL
jgi:hypothetical protein